MDLDHYIYYTHLHIIHVLYVLLPGKPKSQYTSINADCSVSLNVRAAVYSLLFHYNTQHAQLEAGENLLI
ncbi:hypothetical protein XELAEV_18019055mg [Xenopus laevis]|uniref:Uncharacterized protein n=1 Tax=Xenopus laevis TaxID=8355 RepID=A0A974DGH8_XENLA|nr:hypothetical protein XELAEV_18019055mg [Xenopus laevis]